MAKHVTVTPLTDLVDTLAEIVNLKRVPALDGHIYVEDITDSSIKAVVLHAHDDTEVATFTLTVS